MPPRQPPMYDKLEKYDPDFYKPAAAVKDAAQGPSLDAKTRVLITMALDASDGAEGGVKSLARQARALGASEAQIKETLRLVAYVKLNHALATSAHAFEE